MGAMTGLMAGVAAIGVAVALTRWTRRLRDAAATRGAAPAGSATLDFRRDPADGVFRPRG